MNLRGLIRNLPIIDPKYLPEGSEPNTLRIVVSMAACGVAMWAIGQSIAVVVTSNVFFYGMHQDPFLHIVAKHAPREAGQAMPTTLGHCIARLANIGILVLAINALFEIALLVNEPGVSHVRRVLALSFTGMAIYLTKEYPIRESAPEFLLGCLSGLMAGLMWLLYPIGKVLDAGGSAAGGARQS